MKKIITPTKWDTVQALLFGLLAGIGFGMSFWIDIARLNAIMIGIMAFWVFFFTMLNSGFTRQVANRVQKLEEDKQSNL